MMFHYRSVFAFVALIAFLSFTCTSAQGQGCDPRWVGTHARPDADAAVTALSSVPGRPEVIVAGLFTNIAGVAANRIARYNLNTQDWTTVGTLSFGAGAFDIFCVLALPGGDVLLGGSFTRVNDVPAAGFARYTAATNTWGPVPNGVNGRVRCLTRLSNGTVIVGGTFPSPVGLNSPNVALFDPSTNQWSPVGTGTDNNVYAAGVLNDGRFILGGDFLSTRGVPSNRLAIYSPATSSWQAIPGGVAGRVFSIAVRPQGDFVVASTSQTVGGAFGYVGRYDIATNTWSGLNNGFGQAPLQLVATAQGDIIACGAFTTFAPAFPASRVARFNAAANTWERLGDGVNDTANTIALVEDGNGPDLIIGGLFTSIGGPANRSTLASRIARYDFAASQWLATGRGLDREISLLSSLPASAGGSLIAAGLFQTAGGFKVNGIAEFNPTTQEWSALGGGFESNQVRGVVGLPSGDLIAVGVGLFNPDGTTLRSAARYSRSQRQWITLNRGLSAQGNDILTLPGGDLLIAGAFAGAGVVEVNRLARINPVTEEWSPFAADHTYFEFFKLRRLQDGDLLASVTRNFGEPEVLTYFDSATQTWSLTSGGLVGRFVNDIVVISEDTALVCGEFGPSRDNINAYLLRWNLTTNTLTPVQVQLGGSVIRLLTMTLLPDGDVIVAGNFASIGGVTANSIARYRPSTNTWSALPAGLLPNPFANVLDTALDSTGRLAVGGNLVGIPGTLSHSLVRFDFGTPSPVISSNPSSVTTCATAQTQFRVQATGPGALAYAWEISPTGAPGSWQPVANGPTADGFVFSGASTATLVVSRNSPTPLPITRQFRAAVSNAPSGCGRVNSSPATLSICPADRNCDGAVDSDDVITFFGGWDVGNVAADFNGDGGVDSDDVIDFFGRWDLGC